MGECRCCRNLSSETKRKVGSQRDQTRPFRVYRWELQMGSGNYKRELGRVVTIESDLSNESGTGDMQDVGATSRPPGPPTLRTSGLCETPRKCRRRGGCEE